MARGAIDSSEDRLKRRGQLVLSAVPPSATPLGALVCTGPATFDYEGSEVWAVQYVDQDMIICEATSKGGGEEGAVLMLWTKDDAPEKEK